jgi:hypothetical protein
VVGAVRDLLAQDGGDIQVMGSPTLAGTLIEHDLVDEYRLMIEPVSLGGGKRLFPDDGQSRPLELVSTTTSRPYPDWSQSDTALASIARLLRGLHDAARGFDPRGLTWSDGLADPAGGTVVCHNDVEPSNVVFRDGIAVALLDFEFAAPGRPVYDLAHLARLCVPIDDDFDQARLGWLPADRPARLRLLADAYGLDRDGRAALLPAMDDAIDRIEAAARRSVDAGDPNSVEMWNRTGGSERYARRRRWWNDHHDRFAAALL